jgi:hypothetical protein
LSGICPVQIDVLGAHVEDKFQDILNGVKRKSGPSCLEPYAELIDELRLRGHTYRDIVSILAESCQFQTSKSTLNDFVLVRSRRKRNSARRAATEERVAAPIAAPKAAAVDLAQKPSEEEVRQRIAALKARKPATTPSADDFHFDPTQPLRLITREKPGSD